MIEGSDSPLVARVAIIILTHNRRDLTLECLRHVHDLEYPRAYVEIIVVDNASDDDSVQAIQDKFPGVTTLEIKENLGYAGGNNRGIELALERHVDFLLILNNDAFVAPDMLAELVRAAKDPGVGFLGPKVYHQEEPKRIQSAGILLDQLFDSHHRGQDEIDSGQFENVEEVEAISGCALLVSREVLETVGFLDTRFFMYHEEIDWCLRANKAGFRNLYVPSAKAWHPKPQVHSSNTPFTTYYMVRNKYLLLSKHDAGLRVLALAVRKNTIWLLNWTFNPKWRHNREKRNALFKAMVDAALGNYGRRQYVLGR